MSVARTSGRGGVAARGAAGLEIRFARGETICTEHSHKYTLESFAGLARRAGLAVRRVWTDPKARFSVQYLEVRRS